MVQKPTWPFIMSAQQIHIASRLSIVARASTKPPQHTISFPSLPLVMNTPVCCIEFITFSGIWKGVIISCGDLSYNFAISTLFIVSFCLCVMW